MATLDDDLTSLRPNDLVADLVRRVSDARPVQTDRRSNYVSVRPAPSGSIAFYAYAQQVAIAVEPALADETSAAITGSTTKVITPATTHVVITQDGLADSTDAIFAACLHALEWRTTIPVPPTEAAAPVPVPREPDICPTCNTEITRALTCLCDS